jgi:cobalamin synthase
VNTVLSEDASPRVILGQIWAYFPFFGHNLAFALHFLGTTGDVLGATFSLRQAARVTD